MDQERFDKGLARRRATLGDEYVNKSLTNADEFTRPFQEALTEFCWGFCWGDDAIDPKTRSLMNLTMIAALGKMDEWKLHCRGALKNGVSPEELRAAIHVVAVYCGVPAALQCFHAAAPILREHAAAAAAD